MPKTKEAAMNTNEKALLLTVARIMRAKIKSEIYAEREDDLCAIVEALKPFDGLDDVPLNECLKTVREYNGGDTPPI